MRTRLFPFAISVLVAAACSACMSLNGPALRTAGLAVHETLRARIGIEPNRRTARNVILFIGDGMGVSTVTATRIFDGQDRGMLGEEHVLPFERFPHVALVKTYNTNQQVSDSAGTGTAMHSGVKTRAGVIGVGPEALRGDCASARGAEVSTLVEIAEARGMATGIVTTARVTHATPATLYAHLPERDWESDRYLPDAAAALGCRDIARQLTGFAHGDGIELVLGGGRREFLGSALGGQRRGPQDDLLADWRRSASNRTVAATREELAALRADQQVLGLFSDSHMTYVAERSADSTEPTLTEMTESAINLLDARGRGFFLMVEGGRIDHAHHDGRAGYALLEAQAFSAAVAKAVEMTDPRDTLILVTADHSHTLTISGYPTRGNPILGLVVGNDERGEPGSVPSLASDGTPYSTLGYQNGPGAIQTDGPRPRPSESIEAVQQAAIPIDSRGIDGSISSTETHAGEDVALYAQGPWAHLAGGVLEQHAVFHIIAEAFGWTR